MISHAVSDWTGNGRWLQISGFAFRHDPDKGAAEALTLLTGGRAVPIAPDQTILAVTNDYLAKGGDGYTFLPLKATAVADRKQAVDLGEVIRGALQSRDNRGGIAPSVAGRICNDTRPGPCLALAATGQGGGRDIVMIADTGRRGSPPAAPPDTFGGAQEVGMWAEAFSKILSAVVPLVWVALAIYAFWHLRAAIKDTIPRLGSVKVPGLEVSLAAAAQAVTAAVELSAKHRNWPVHVPDEDKRAALARAGRERALLDGAEILWVDDRPGNNRNEWRMFRSLGSYVTAAASTAEAVDLIIESREPAGRVFHVVISDIAREGSDDTGLKTLAAFQERQERLPLIFYVGTIEPDLGTPPGAFGITNRPDQLLNLVLDALARTRIPT